MGRAESEAPSVRSGFSGFSKLSGSIVGQEAGYRTLLTILAAREPHVSFGLLHSLNYSLSSGLIFWRRPVHLMAPISLPRRRLGGDRRPRRAVPPEDLRRGAGLFPSRPAPWAPSLFVGESLLSPCFVDGAAPPLSGSPASLR